MSNEAEIAASIRAVAESIDRATERVIQGRVEGWRDVGWELSRLRELAVAVETNDVERVRQVGEPSSDAAYKREALSKIAPIDAEEARKLAGRLTLTASGSIANCGAAGWPAFPGFTRIEVKRLLWWVCAEMACASMPGVFADAVKESGLSGEREVLAYCVGKKLGGRFRPGTGGWHRLALELCNLAGWPS